MTKSWNDLVQLLNLAAEDAQHWEEVCDAIVDVMGATGVIFVPANPNFRGQWMSCSTALKSALPEYLAGGWHLKDPREKVTTLMLEKGYATDNDVFPDLKTKHEMPFYKEFLCKHNFGTLTALKILTPNGYWGAMIHFANDDPGMSDDQLVSLKRLRTLLENTAKRAFEIAHKSMASFAQFFSQSETEIFILDAHASQTLRMDNFGNLIRAQGIDKLLPPAIDDQMKADLIELCSSNPELSLSTAYTFQENKRNITVLAVQAPTALRHFFMPLKACAIRTISGDLKALKQKKLSAKFDMTVAEISTLELLSAGKTAQSIADIMGLKPTSIRQRLKKIYEKTHVNSQVELLALYNNL